MAERSAVAALDKKGLERRVSLALDEALRRGMDQAEVAASQDIGLTATARLGAVESLEFTNDRALGITVYKDRCKGSATTSDVSDAAIREAVGKACVFAGLTARDKYAGLADAEQMADADPDLDLDHPWDLDADQAISMAIQTEEAALASDRRIGNSEGATVSSNRGSRAYGNTHGFLKSYSRTSHSLNCVVLAEADGELQRDYHYTAARDAGKLDPPTAIGREAARRALARLGARKIDTTQAPVLFVPELARGFIGHAVAAISGGAQYRRASFLLDAVGKTVFSPAVSIAERPHLKGAMASRSYDADGVATWDREIVANGELQGYILSSYSARRLGLETTANAGGAQNLLLAGSDTDLAAMIRDLPRGLVVTELIGQGVNPVTGDYSRGAVGFWVENGEVQHAVHEVTIAGNLLDLYRRIAIVGNDRDCRSGVHCGSLLVEEMTIAGA